MANSDRIFELRTYVASPGKRDALQARFRDHTVALFEKHGMEVLGFWVPADGGEGSADTLIYLLAFPDRAAATASWAAFQGDPDWISAKEKSEVDGRLAAKVESLFLDPTDYSAMR